MAAGRLAHVVAFDDAPFGRGHRGPVLVVGVAYARLRLEGVLGLHVQRDGADATAALAAAVAGSRHAAQAQAILLQGIALAGFNVVDINALAALLGIAVVVVMRRPPRQELVRRALLERVPGGTEKWAAVERAGPPRPAAGVLLQLAGLELDEAGALVASLAVNGRIPEPLRVAHLIAGGVTTGHSRGRA